MNCYMLEVHDRLGDNVWVAQYLHRSPHGVGHVIQAVLLHWFGPDTEFDAATKVATAQDGRQAEVMNVRAVPEHHFDFLVRENYMIEL